MDRGIHHIPGRIRIRLPDVKGSPEAARRVESELRALEGVRGAQANPITGSVLVRYDAGHFDPTPLIRAHRARTTRLDRLAELATRLAEAKFPIATAAVGLFL